MYLITYEDYGNQKIKNKITITYGNNKLGNIPNISLPPDKTCLVRCDFCYARKFYRWKNVKETWDSNLNFYLENRDQYFFEIDKYLRKKKLNNLFRFHVGGDIVDSEYFDGVVNLSKDNPGFNFCIYTKKINIVLEYENEIPPNLNLFLSIHPDNYQNNIKYFRKSWITGLNFSEYDILIAEKLKNGEAVLCPATNEKKSIKCENCKMCYNPILKKDIVFKKH